MTVTFDAMQAMTEPAFSRGNPELYVPFAVRRFAGARVAWLNRRWFARHEVDVGDPGRLRPIVDWLLARYGVAAPGIDDPARQYVGPTETLHADRYGGPAGCFHGGSGRVGTFGAFNVKGVGRTPLVSKTSDWYHTHGCMWLEEAVREAVLSEVVANCFPCGAVPVIAVIDAGCPLYWRDGSTGAQRGLIVRPAHLRVASFMRSVFFGDGGSDGSDQARDARRVECLWRQPETNEQSFVGAFHAAGRQYGFGAVMRLWPGPPFASNLTLDGRLVDFGSFRALPDWSRVQGDLRSHGFGNEIELIEVAARALDRLGRRYDVPVSADLLIDAYREGADDGHKEAMSRCSIEGGSLRADAFARLQGEQQRRRVDLVSDRRPAPAITGRAPADSLYRERLLSDTQRMIDALPPCADARSAQIADFIHARIAAGIDQVNSNDASSAVGSRLSKASAA